jgi:hypothetical protein
MKESLSPLLLELQRVQDVSIEPADSPSKIELSEHLSELCDEDTVTVTCMYKLLSKPLELYTSCKCVLSFESNPDDELLYKADISRTVNLGPATEGIYISVALQYDVTNMIYNPLQNSITISNVCIDKVHCHDTCVLIFSTDEEYEIVVQYFQRITT